ncbi:MAG TPA: TetR/AcrR family transcriptional regulator [Solirubrobacterales bacterium]|nr:TetR/AcrR family transcriptional regulator [Solirubrobacterales bacterium]
MVVTPWGDSETLRTGMLTPGPSNSPEAVAENQRQRLFGAMVASVAERGYTDTRISDLVESSGVSLRSFYDLFPDKQACFIGAVEALVRSTVGPVLESDGPAEWEVDSKRRLGTAAALAAAQPAAAKLCLVETYAAGPAVGELVDEATARIEGLIAERLEASPRWSGLPSEIGTFAIGTIFETFRSRLIDEQAHRLPEITDQLTSLLLHYEPPVRPLRSAARPPEVRPEQLEASDHAERALRAFEALLTEQALGETTMEQVAKRAGMSVRTLYANFGSRQDLMLAAIDSAGAQVVATALPAYRREASPSEGIRVALSATLGLLASRPNLANLLLDAAYAGGGSGLRRRAEALQPLRALLARVAPGNAEVSRGFFAEALLGGVLWLARRRAFENGPGSLPGLVPIVTYIALAPLLGPEQATAAAEGKSYRRPSMDQAHSLRLPLAQPNSDRIATSLSQEPLTLEAICDSTRLAPEEVQRELERLIELGAVQTVAGEDGGLLFESRWPVRSTPEWERMSISERERDSAAIGLAIKGEVEASVAAGLFDVRPERFLTRFPLWVDEQGWHEVHEFLEVALEQCYAVQQRARKRLDEKGGQAGGFPARVILASYETPPLRDGDS